MRMQQTLVPNESRGRSENLNTPPPSPERKTGIMYDITMTALWASTGKGVKGHGPAAMVMAQNDKQEKISYLAHMMTSVISHRHQSKIHSLRKPVRCLWNLLKHAVFAAIWHWSYSRPFWEIWINSQVPQTSGSHINLTVLIPALCMM